MNLDSIAASVSAAVAVASAVVAALARLDAKRSARAAERSAQAAEDLTVIESTRDEQAADEKRREQAVKVSGWFGETIYRPDLPGGKNRRFWKATARNASGLPVYDVRVEFHKVVSRDDEPFQSVERGHEVRSMLPPDDELQLDGPDEDQDYVVALRFRDAAGVVWYRDAQGRLSEVTA